MSLGLTLLLTVSVSVVLFCLCKKTSFGSWNPFLRQTVIGVALGICAIYATEFGSMSTRWAAINARDFAVISSGLLFGPWAGILSGLIAAAERFFVATPIFGMGAYTQVSCTFATLFAGFFSALFYQILFNKKRPLVLQAIVFVMIVEVVHVMAIPAFHLNDLKNAILVTYKIFVPIILVNSIGITIVFFMTSYLNMRFKGKKPLEIITKAEIFFTKDLFFSFQVWLLMIFISAFCINVLIIAVIINNFFLKNTEDRFYNELISLEHVVDKGVNVVDTEREEVAAYFAEDWSDDNVANYFIVDKNGEILNVINSHASLVDKVRTAENLTLLQLNHNDEIIYYMVKKNDDYISVIYSMEINEMFLPHLITIMTLFLQISVFGITMLLVFVLLKRQVSENLDKINTSLREITRGNLNEKVDVYSHEEFIHLSNSINKTVETLRKYIQAESERYKEDIEMAKQIQKSSLPSKFPPFPNDPEFDLHAKYKSAREVGGDFYDYYFVDKHTLAFLIADVSGKGIPAAMFMMRGKTACRVFSDKHKDPAKTLHEVNNYLCDDNDAELFVTCWLGMINIKTGVLKFANAGHNPPVIVDSETGNVNYLKGSTSLVMGGIKNIKYKNCEYKFNPGDKLLLYTDGITEAHNATNNLYGENRLLELCGKNRENNVRVLCEKVFRDVEFFKGRADQFDDMTVLSFIYNGQIKHLENGVVMSELTVSSKIDNITKVCDVSSSFLTKTGCPEKYILQFNVCIDELFSNIVNYGYKNDRNFITINIIAEEKNNRKVVKMTFIDTAPKFNPLDKNAPDITAKAEDRELGGLGIYMVREMMDDVFYEYKAKANNLTIVKYY